MCSILSTTTDNRVLVRLGSGAVTCCEPSAFTVRAARPGDEDAIARVCRAGFGLSSRGLLPPEVIERQAAHYYDVNRVRREIEPHPHQTSWQGYVVAVSPRDEVLGAAGGGVGDGAVGNVLVLYLDPPLRGRGIGTALLDHLTGQQLAAGATEQWVSVTEGNELAVPFYRARGFIERGRVPYIAANDSDPVGTSLRMSRPITRP
jgi:ribosomal protein S18 acetylase RimI-like enzyme